MTIGVNWKAIWKEAIWKRVWLQSPGADTTPNPFSFTSQLNVALSITVVSAPVVISGLNALAPITVSGGSYDINGSGVFVSTAGTISNGDSIRASHTSSPSFLTLVSTTVTIGGVSASFNSTTLVQVFPGANRVRRMSFKFV